MRENSEDVVGVGGGVVVVVVATEVSIESLQFWHVGFVPAVIIS